MIIRLEKVLLINNCPHSLVAWVHILAINIRCVKQLSSQAEQVQHDDYQQRTIAQPRASDNYTEKARIRQPFPAANRWGREPVPASLDASTFQLSRQCTCYLDIHRWFEGWEFPILHY